jgi:hypothetical protein
VGRSQKQKGDRFERWFAKKIGGERVPLSGALGGKYVGDVTGLNLTWECKSRKDAFKTYYKWLEKVDALVIKSDRQEALVVIPLQKFLEGWSSAKQQRSNKNS